MSDLLLEIYGEELPSSAQIDGKKQLNYEIMFQLLQGEVEKHILENNGNPVVDEFKQKIITKFSSLIQQLND